MALEFFLNWKNQPGDQAGIKIHGLDKAPLRSNGPTLDSAAPRTRQHHADTRPFGKPFFTEPHDETLRNPRWQAKRVGTMNTTNRHHPRHHHQP
jgi:hypothetical protein